MGVEYNFAKLVLSFFTIYFMVQPARTANEVVIQPQSEEPQALERAQQNDHLPSPRSKAKTRTTPQKSTKDAPEQIISNNGTADALLACATEQQVSFAMFYLYTGWQTVAFRSFLIGDFVHWWAQQDFIAHKWRLCTCLGLNPHLAWVNVMKWEVHSSWDSLAF